MSTSIDLFSNIFNSGNIPEWASKIQLRRTSFRSASVCGKFDKLNAMFISKAIVDEEIKDLILMQDLGTATLHWAVLSAALCTYEENYSDPDASIYGSFKRGDIILIDGKPVEFVGFKNNLEQICFYEKAEKGLKCLNIRPTSEYKGRITLSGRIKKAGRFSGQPAKTIQRHSLFASLYNVNEEDVCPRASILVVTQKSQYKSELENLFITYEKKPGVEGEDYFAKSIPMVYQQNTENENRILLRNDQRAPLVRVTSSLSAAVEIIRNNESIDKLIIDGDSKVAAHLYELKKIIETNTIKRKILLLTQHVDKKTLMEIKNLGFTSWIWNESAIKKVYADFALTKDIENSPQDPFYIQSRNLLNLNELERKILKIPYPESESKTLLRALTKQILILGHFIRTNKVEVLEELIIKARGFKLEILSPFFHMVSGGTENHAKLLVGQISDLCLKARRFIFDSEILKTIEGLALSVKSLADTFSSSKKVKADELQLILKAQKPNTAIVFRKSAHISMAREVVGKNQSNLKLLTLNDLKNTNYYEEIIFSGWLGERHGNFLSTPYSKKHTYLVYDVEEEMLNFHLIKEAHQAFQISSPEERAKLLGISPQESKNLFEFDATVLDFEKFQDRKHILRESKMENFVSNLWPNITGLPNESEKGVETSATLVVFEDDKFAYLTDRYMSKCLDRDKGNVFEKDINNLAIGDELLFLKDDRRDLFEEIVKALEKENPSVVNKAGAWRKALIELKDAVGASTEELQKVLADLGLNVEIFTLRNWLEPGKVIAPDQFEQLMSVLSNRLPHLKLDAQKPEIKKSIKTVRSSRILAGKHLAQAIIGAYNSEDNQKALWLKKFVQQIRDLRERVSINQVQRIYPEKKNVSIQITNRLIER